MTEVQYNYTALMSKDMKIYAIGNTVISQSGLSISFLKIVAPMAVLGTVIGLGLNALLGTHYYDLLGGNFNLTYFLLTTGLGTALGLALYYVKPGPYRLYEYIIAWSKPKYIYNNEGKRAKRQYYKKIKVDGMIEGVL